ncbi:unnamed protein product, partial [Didymodactylos carnosus]
MDARAAGKTQTVAHARTGGRETVPCSKPWRSGPTMRSFPVGKTKWRVGSLPPTHHALAGMDARAAGKTQTVAHARTGGR